MPHAERDLAPHVRGDRPRVQRVRRHAGALEAPGELARVQDVGELRHAVLVERRAGRARAAHGVPVDALGPVVTGAGDVDDPARSGRGEVVAEQLGEQERTDVVGAEGELEAARGHPPLAGETGVVDQDVEPLAGGQEGRGRRPHRGEVAQVERQVVEVGVAGLAGDLADRLPRPLRGATGEHHPRAPARQRPHRLLADPRVRARHQERLAAQLAHVPHPDRRATALSSSQGRRSGPLGSAQIGPRATDRSGKHTGRQHARIERHRPGPPVARPALPLLRARRSLLPAVRPGVRLRGPHPLSRSRDVTHVIGTV
ncbi:hypothetical protein KR76_13520 [Pimelobacter simplex]|uniref:Uncharacterized protein n=1 Tax=Nocardioides simplex TaxID=2045 RepID=A0A0A1DRE0_NOCSI|nr:hypothetical protein KR76_13520 [Pimelobacter simplex]